MLARKETEVGYGVLQDVSILLKKYTTHTVYCRWRTDIQTQTNRCGGYSHKVMKELNQMTEDCKYVL